MDGGREDKKWILVRFPAFQNRPVIMCQVVPDIARSGTSKIVKFPDVIEEDGNYFQ